MRLFLVCREPRFSGLLTVLVLTALVTGCERGTSLADGGSGPDSTLPEFSAADFSQAEDCQPCHPDQYDEWSGSMHAYTLKSPVFQALNLRGQLSSGNTLDQECVKCHGTIGSRALEIPSGIFDINSLPPVVQEGVGCDLCHSITSIGALQNAGIVVTPGNVKYGSTVYPIDNPVHESAYHSLYETSEYCAACHDIVSADGFGLQTTFREWRGGGFTMTGRTCNGCHMPTYTGSAAVGAPERTLHRHWFIGADVALSDFPNKPQQLQLVTEMLRSALTVELDMPPAVALPGQLFLFGVRLTNDKTGHDVPTGATFLRQMWLSVVVTDNTGGTIYSSGQLDANDDLMDEHSEFPQRDPDLFNTQATLLRADGTPTPNPWEAAALINPSIKVGETQTTNYEFIIPPVGPVTVVVKLRYRTFPPYVIRSLELDELLPIPIIDMAEETRVITVLGKGAMADPAGG